MMASAKDDDLASANEVSWPEPLSRPERISALCVGIVSGGLGGYAVFDTSNQAGTVMLLIIAAVFLLIGVQGTPLIKFTSSSGSLELERRRRTKVREALQKASEEPSVEKAAGIVEGVSIVAPDLLPRSFDRYKDYEDSLAHELSMMGYTVSKEPKVRGLRPDFAIQQNADTIYIEVKLYSTPIPVSVVNQGIGMAAVLSAPVVIVATSELGATAGAIIQSVDNVKFVRWRDHHDDPQLRETLRALHG